jgi:hypothetical protein
VHRRAGRPAYLAWRRGSPGSRVIHALAGDRASTRHKQMAKARDKVRVCAHARIVGLVFWDRPHNVTGRAPNSIELHPILDFALPFGLTRSRKTSPVRGRRVLVPC